MTIQEHYNLSIEKYFSMLDKQKEIGDSPKGTFPKGFLEKFSCAVRDQAKCNRIIDAINADMSESPINTTSFDNFLKLKK